MDKSETSASAAPVLETQMASYIPFEIHKLNRTTPDIEYQLQRLYMYELFWIKKGAGRIKVGLNEFILKEGNVYFLLPGQLRTLLTDSVLEGYYLAIATDFFYSSGVDFNFPLLSYQNFDLHQPKVVSLPQDAQCELEELLGKMNDEFKSMNLLRHEFLRSYCKIVFLFLSRKAELVSGPQVASRENTLASKFVLLLSKHFHCQKTVMFYASELCVTRSYLNQAVKKVTGFTVSSYIQNYIVMEAKQQAILSSRSMKEIAYNLGFDDISHFSKFFKNTSGTNFSSFKSAQFKFNTF